MLYSKIWSLALLTRGLRKFQWTWTASSTFRGIQDLYEPVASRKASSTYPSYIFIPSESMYSTLLLASFLAVLPMSLICLALKSLNPCIHLNQFVHTLYPRPPLAPVNPLIAFLVVLFFPMALCINSWDAASKHTHFVASSGSGSMTPDGCAHFANRLPSLQMTPVTLQTFSASTFAFPRAALQV